ncbi:hypothetical protein BAE44_0004144, partial [Dichanthelium oligosanthes]
LLRRARRRPTPSSSVREFHQRRPVAREPPRSQHAQVCLPPLLPELSLSPVPVPERAGPAPPNPPPVSSHRSSPTTRREGLASSPSSSASTPSSCCRGWVWRGVEISTDLGFQPLCVGKKP